MLANQGGLEPFFDQPLARPRDRVDTALQGRRDLAVAPALTTLRGVGFQQDPGLQQLLCWMVSAMDKGGEMLSLLITQYRTGSSQSRFRKSESKAGIIARWWIHQSIQPEGSPSLTLRQPVSAATGIPQNSDGLLFRRTGPSSVILP